MTLKARTATTVIPEGCPMHQSSSASASKNDTNERAYGGYTNNDSSKPIKTIKATGQPLSGDAKKDWVLTQDQLAKRTKQRILLGFKTIFAFLVCFVFVKACLITSAWLYQVPPELLE